MEEEVWINLEHMDFPNYAVSDLGRVRSDITGRILKQHPNQQGIYKVGLVREKGGGPVTQSVSRLVATHFVEGESDGSNTPINLDGDRANNRASNLAWRPRWFAVRYHRQFDYRPAATYPVVCLDTDEVFVNAREASMRYGILEADIVQDCYSQNGVWPHGYDFRRYRE